MCAVMVSVRVWMGWRRGFVQPLVPFCLFDKSNRWPLTVKSLPRCRRGRGCRDTAPVEQVLWRAGKRRRRRSQEHKPARGGGEEG